MKSRKRSWFGMLASIVAVGGLVPLALSGPTANADPVKLRQPAGQTVENSYIVVLKKDAVSAADHEVQDLARELGGAVGKTYQHAMRGFAVNIDHDGARKIAGRADVAYVQPNHRWDTKDTQLNPPNWGLDRIDQAGLPLTQSYSYPTAASGNDASKVHAYVLDSGIRLTHKTFGGRATSGYDSWSDDTDATPDCTSASHGTHVAGILGGRQYGVAKNVRLVAVKIMGCDEYADITEASVIAGIDWVAANAIRPAVANMSVGGPRSEAANDAVAALVDSGVPVIAAAGNEDADACESSPASSDRVITVAAVNKAGRRAGGPIDGSTWGSNWGECVSIFAPGDAITSSVATSDTATDSWPGTSMATPHVAGVAALILGEHPSWTPEQVYSEILRQSVSGRVSDLKGSPDRLLNYKSGCYAGAGADVKIPDFGEAVGSNAVVSGCTRTPSKSATVTVKIKHPKRGDLTIGLVAPDGTLYRLKQTNLLDLGADVDREFTVDLSDESGDGTWRLQVRDGMLLGAGRIDSWKLNL